MILDSPKLCECGCGQPLPPTNKRQRFIHNHHGRKPPVEQYCETCGNRIPHRYPSKYCSLKCHGLARTKYFIGPNPSGLCMCGCGQPTPIADETNARAHRVKGQHIRFIEGHFAKVAFAPAAERFWEKADTSGGSDACWPWRGFIDHNGYGKMNAGGHKVFVHRFSYELRYGPIPDGLLVCHNCPDGDNPHCVNPTHMFLGSHADNSQDASRKGRMHPGERNGSAKLKEYQVREILNLATKSLAELAELYQVSEATISNVIRRKTWRHVT